MSGAAATAEKEEESGLDFGGWKPTGRKTVGPDSELVELENPEGHKQTAIVYDKAWRDHHRLTTDVDLVRSFMEFPMVEGIACLTRAPTGQGLFQYDTGSVLAIIEVLRAYRDQRKTVGTRAAYEMLTAIGDMLQEASENGPMQGIYSHGGITPWRVALDAEGSVQLLGYGLPQMDMEALREDDTLRVRDDSYKYCPPERLTSGYEDISTDIYSLVLIAYEMITGEPLLTGRAEELKNRVVMGEAQTLMMGAKKAGIPKAMMDAFVHALAFDPIGRYEQPWEFVQALSAAESQVSGETLAEVMAQVRSTTRRGKALMDVGTAGGPRRATLGDRETRMKSAAQARPVRGRASAQRGAGKATVDGGGRWGKVARSGSSDEEESSASRSIAGRPSRRRRGADTSGAEEEGSAIARRARRRGAGGDEEEAESTGRRSLRTSRRGGGDDEAEESSVRGRARSRRGASTPEEDEPSSRRRTLRRSASTDEDEGASRVRSRRRSADAEEEEEETPAAEERPTRRSRRGSEEEEPATPPTRTRSRRGASTEDDEDTAKEETTEEEEESPTRSRRSSRLRRSASADAEEKPEEKAEEETSTRSRRSRRSASADDEDEAKPEEKAEEETSTRSLRSRRSASTEADEDEAPTPTRSRRSRRSASSDEDEDEKPAADASEDEDEDEGGSTATRSRRSRRSASSDKDEDEAPAATRSRRSRRSASSDKDEDEDEDEKPAPTRSRRSRRSSSSDDE